MASPAMIDNVSELAAVFKTVYAQGVEQQQNLTTFFWKRLGDAEITFGGNAWEFPARMTNAQSVGARGYRMGLPQPIQNQDVTARVRHKFNYATFDITGPDIYKGRGNVNAFVNSQTDKMRSLLEMAEKDLQQQCFLDGTGVRATAKSAWSTGAVQVDRIKYLRQSAHVDVISNTDGATKRGGNGDNDPNDSDATRFTVNAISASDSNFSNNPSITLAKGIPLANTTPTSAVTADFIVRHKTLGSELTGLQGLVDDGVYDAAALVLQDIDRSLSTLWKAKVFANGGTARDLSLNLMQIAMDYPEMISGRRIDLVIGSYNARDRYLQLLVPQKRFTDLKLDGGYQMLEYNGRDFLVDNDCQDDTVYFLNKESLKKFGLFKMQFDDQAGGILKHDNLAGGDVFYSYLRTICNLGVMQANANSKIVDLTVDANYIVSY